MYIKHLNIKNFRNFENLELNFNPEKNINILIAPNGMGKSNLLESIYYLSYLRSFRNVPDKELIKKGEKHFFLQGNFQKENFSEDVSVKFAGKKEIFCSGKKIQKHSEIISKILTIVFCIEDVFIITGNPVIRRRYFDMFFSIIDRNYLDNLKIYSGVMKQKNFILKQQNRNELLDVYDIQLSKCIEYIQKKREILIQEIDQCFQEIYQKIGNFKEKSKILYMKSLKSTDSKEIAIELSKTREKDYENGFCTAGIHKDNYLFLLNGLNFGKYASYGQIRLASLVLKYIQNLFFLKIYDEKPIILLDDVIIELDRIRQKNFMNHIINDNQVFITIANKENISYIYENNSSNEIRINYGKTE